MKARTLEDAILCALKLADSETLGSSVMAGIQGWIEIDADAGDACAKRIEAAIVKKFPSLKRVQK